MNDRMSDMDSLVEKAVESLAHAVYARTGQNPFRDALTEDVTIALRHAGLPALLERVEAAKAEHGALLEAHTELLGQFAKVYDQRDALAAKVAAVKTLLIGAVLVDADAVRAALDGADHE